MKKVIILSLLSLSIITSCSKDKGSDTKPVITFTSYSYAPIQAAGGVDVTFEVRDGDGDIENTFNVAPIFDQDPTIPDSVPFTPHPMPGLDNNKGRNLTAQVILHLFPTDFPQVGANPVTKDSVRYRVFVVDDAGHSSDTIVTPKVQVLY